MSLPERLRRPGRVAKSRARPTAGIAGAAEAGRGSVGYTMSVPAARRRRGNAGMPQRTRTRRQAMQAAVGDRLHVHGNIVGHPDRAGEIVEVRGTGGEPPYLVRFDDGHTSLVFPGPDAIIEHPRRKGRKGPAKA